MSEISRLHPTTVLGCQSTVFHQIGRPPFAPFLVNGKSFCFRCLKLRIAEAPTLVHTAAAPPLQLVSAVCHRAHLIITPSDIRLDGTPVCWDCANEELRRGHPVTLSVLGKGP